jgi:hypothetical protein
MMVRTGHGREDWRDLGHGAAHTARLSGSLAVPAPVARGPRPDRCVCGSCRRCKQRAYSAASRARWTPEQRQRVIDEQRERRARERAA